MSDKVRGFLFHQIETAFINVFIPTADNTKEGNVSMDDAVQLCIDNDTIYQIGDKNNLYVENNVTGHDTIKEITDVLAPTSVTLYKDQRSLPTLQDYLDEKDGDSKEKNTGSDYLSSEPVM